MTQSLEPMDQDKLMGRQTVSVLNMKKTDNDPRGIGQDSPVKSYVSLPWELWAVWQGPQGMCLLPLHRANCLGCVDREELGMASLPAVLLMLQSITHYTSKSRTKLMSVCA